MPDLSGALAAGFVAKEIVVSTLAQTVGVAAEEAAAAFLVFVLLYVPCVATVATFAHEFGRRWAGFSVALSVVVAWLAAVGVFRAGALIGGA